MEQPNAQTTRKKWYKRWWAILLFSILALFLATGIAFGLMVRDYIKKIKSGEIVVQNAAGSDAQAEQVRKFVESSDDPYLGAEDPKITIVEFFDFKCPRCKEAHTTVRALASLYKDDVKIILRDFPVIEDDSMTLAMAGACAHEQGKFWPLHDRLFEEQDNITAETLSSIAQETGMDVNKFLQCISIKKYEGEVLSDLHDAITLEAGGTPTWFINGYKVEGVIPLETFKQMIDAMLKKP